MIHQRTVKILVCSDVEELSRQMTVLVNDYYFCVGPLVVTHVPLNQSLQGHVMTMFYQVMMQEIPSP